MVSDSGVEVHDLNELEYIHGEIYANVWQTNLIAMISPKDGHVVGWIDLTGLLPASERANSDAVLNGIAFDAAHNRLFVTGKLWPKLFEIQSFPRARALINSSREFAQGDGARDQFCRLFSTRRAIHSRAKMLL